VLPGLECFVLEYTNWYGDLAADSATERGVKAAVLCFCCCVWLIPKGKMLLGGNCVAGQ